MRWVWGANDVVGSKSLNGDWSDWAVSVSLWFRMQCINLVVEFSLKEKILSLLAFSMCVCRSHSFTIGRALFSSSVPVILRIPSTGEIFFL